MSVKAEVGLLESLGHLTRSGDNVITQLLAANAARLEKSGGDFVDVHDFVARLRPFFPGADLSINAGQAFEEATALGLVSPQKIETSLGADALDETIAVARIAAFNRWLKSTDAIASSLNPHSADVLVVSMLEKMLDRVEGNHPTGRGKGRTARIFYIAHDYRRYRNGSAHVEAAE